MFVPNYAKKTCYFIFLFPIFLACSPNYSHQENAVTDKIEFSNRLKKIYAKKKIICFGRYVLEVPNEAEFTWGMQAFPSDIKIIDGDQSEIKEQVAKDVDGIKLENDSAQIMYDGVGPVPGSRQIRYYDSSAAKKVNLYLFNTYISKINKIYVFYDAMREGENEGIVVQRQAHRIKNHRQRSDEDIPTDPGQCIRNGFLANDAYDDQEMVAVGLNFPSLPDVTFSISSNKDAYGDYPLDEFENRLRAKLSLLNRIKEARDAQGVHYPTRSVLREGKRMVQHWRGEESLFRRKDGTHDFEWASVGTPRDVASLSDFLCGMGL